MLDNKGGKRKLLFFIEKFVKIHNAILFIAYIHLHEQFTIVYQVVKCTCFRDHFSIVFFYLEKIYTTFEKQQFALNKNQCGFFNYTHTHTHIFMYISKYMYFSFYILYY